jgi:YVTN family beta-propeller protein
VNPGTHHAYVPNQDSNSVSVIDGTTDTVVHTLFVQQLPTFVGVNARTNRVYVSNQDSASVSVIKDTRH